MFIKRVLFKKFTHYLKLFPVVSIIGPRQAGKTTFAKMELPNWDYFNLEKISDFNRIEADIEFFLKEYAKKCVIEHLIQYYQLTSNDFCQFFFYRTTQGDEIDLLVKKGANLIAYELKTSTSIDKKELS